MENIFFTIDISLVIFFLSIYLLSHNCSIVIRNIFIDIVMSSFVSSKYCIMIPSLLAKYEGFHTYGISCIVVFNVVLPFFFFK